MDHPTLQNAPETAAAASGEIKLRRSRVWQLAVCYSKSLSTVCLCRGLRAFQRQVSSAVATPTQERAGEPLRQGPDAPGSAHHPHRARGCHGPS